MMDLGKAYRHSTIGFYASVYLQFQLVFFFKIERHGKHKVYQCTPEQFSNACFHAHILLCIYTHKKESDHEELLYLSGSLVFVHLVLTRTSIYILFTCFLLMWQKLIEDTTKHAKDTLRDLMFSWGAERITNSAKFVFMAWHLFIGQSINQFYILICM